MIFLNVNNLRFTKWTSVHELHETGDFSILSSPYNHTGPFLLRVQVMKYTNIMNNLLKPVG